MNPRALRVLRVPVTIALIWAALAYATPILMTKYSSYVLRPGFGCAGSSIFGRNAPGACRSLADMYATPFPSLFADSGARSLALLAGATVLALTLGTLLGVVGALWRRHAFASGAIVAATTVLASVPAFFVAYFLQIAVIMLGASSDSRERLLPVFGFGYDSHLVLPLLSISLPAITYTAQLTALRTMEVLDADFITAARAKGLGTSWILFVHVLPHVRPVLLEALGSGLRVSVASLPIVEYLFLWRGVGQLALEAIGIHDATGFVLSCVVLAALFTTLSAIADLSRPKALYSPA